MPKINRELDTDKQKIIDLYQGGMTLDEVGKEYSVSHAAINKRLKAWGQPTRSRKKYTVEACAFDTLSPSSCYWLGYLAGDGAVHGGRSGTSYSVILASTDKEHIEKFRAFVGSNAPVAEKKSGWNSNGKQIYFFRLNSAQMGKTLIGYGLIPNKSLSMSISSQELLSSKDFLRGIIDSDGCIHYKEGKGGSISIVTGSRVFSDQLTKMFQLFWKITPHVYSIRKKYFGLSLWRKEEVMRVASDLYSSVDPEISLDRKRGKAMTILNVWGQKGWIRYGL